MGHLQHVLWSTVTYARVHGPREVRGDLTVGTGRMPPLANNLHGDETDDRMQSTQLWLDAIHLGSKPSTEVMPIQESLISKHFQYLLRASRQLTVRMDDIHVPLNPPNSTALCSPCLIYSLNIHVLN